VKPGRSTALRARGRDGLHEVRRRGLTPPNGSGRRSSTCSARMRAFALRRSAGWNTATGSPLALTGVTDAPASGGAAARRATRRCGMIVRRPPLRRVPRQAVPAPVGTPGPPLHGDGDERQAGRRPLAGMVLPPRAPRNRARRHRRFRCAYGGGGSGITPYTLTKIMGTSTCDVIVAPDGRDGRYACGRDMRPGGWVRDTGNAGDGGGTVRVR